MALEVGDLETAAATLDRTLDAARKIVGGLLQAGDPVAAGDLVRHHAADEQDRLRP
jgi:hypothetical protein